MFLRLLIQNFQGHSKLAVDLGHPISTIVGDTDAGKSALLRALKWVCLNTPDGDSFIKRGERGTTCQLILEDHKITRRRGVGDNSYHLDDQEFVAFGRGAVPDPIAKILNVGERNFQGQHDSVFWFSQTAGEVSRQLNSVVDLGIIDSSLAAIAQKVRLCQSTIQITKDRLDKAKIKKESLEWVLEADAQYTEVEKLESVKTHKTAHVALLRTGVHFYQSVERTRLAASGAYTAVCVVGKLGRAALNAEEKWNALVLLIRSLKRNQEIVDNGYPDINALESKLDAHTDAFVKKSDLRRLIVGIKKSQSVVDRGAPDISDLEALLKSYNEAAAKVKLLDDLMSDVHYADAAWSHAASAHEDAVMELEKELDGRCPLCGKGMDDATETCGAETERNDS